MTHLRRRVWSAFIGVAFCLPGVAIADPAGVRAWEEQVAIPTYPIGPEESYPTFASLGGRNIYPYAMQTRLTRDRQEVSYRVLFLENEYLRVMVLPELGGRLYSLYDKSSGREVFYRNHVIKPGLVGQRGAWISGGIEFNFPTGHTVTGFSPVLGTYREHADGSASITVGDIEKVTRMFWSVTLALHPGVAALQEEVHLYNRTHLPHRYYFWNNSAFPARPQTRFTSPARYQTNHSGSFIYSWPQHEGEDISWDRNHDGSQSYFGLDVAEDFFGAYDHEADAGLVHVADRRALPGKKFWTWGTGSSSQRWVDILTDDDGQYVEVQSGRFWNQSTWRPLMPQETVHWTEWWFGVSGIGGFNYATENGALMIEPDGSQLTIGISPTRNFGRGHIEVEQDGRLVAQADVELNPAVPVTTSLQVPDAATAVIRIVAGKEEAFYYDPAAHENPQEATAGRVRRASRTSSDSRTPEEILYEARELVNRANFEEAGEALLLGLQKDPGHAGLLVALGFLELTDGLFVAAEARFARALERDGRHAGALYGKAVAASEQGNDVEAALRVRRLFDDPVYGTAARLLTGQTMMRSGRYREAAAVFENSAARTPLASKAASFHAASLRALGRSEEALVSAEAALRVNPLSTLAAAEAWLCLQRLERMAEAGKRRRQLAALMAQDPDILLEVAVDYRSIGDDESAGAVLRQTLPGKATAPEGADPVALYHLADVQFRLGQTADAEAMYRAAAAVTTRDRFPYRLETLAVLARTSERAPQDAAAHYYSGDILARHRRLDEALDAWQRSMEIDPSNAVAARNAGMALAEVERDHDGAVGAYRQAIVAAPTDAELYSELDDVYREAGADLDTRLANIQAGLRHGTSDDLATDAARLLNEAGRYRETLDLLAAQHFNIWEGSSSIHRLYEEAHVSSGIAAHESGNYPTALEHFEQAMEYPENLGEARSERDQLARPKYWAGRAQEALGRGEEAAVLYRAATEEEYRRVSPSQYYQGLAYRALGQESEADGVFRDLIDSAEDSRGGSLMATLLAGLGHHGLGQQQKAEELLRSFLADPALSSSGGRSGWRRRYAIRHVGLVRQILAE